MSAARIGGSGKRFSKNRLLKGRVTDAWWAFRPNFASRPPGTASCISSGASFSALFRRTASEYLQPEIMLYQREGLGLILGLLENPSPLVQQKACYGTYRHTRPEPTLFASVPAAWISCISQRSLCSQQCRRVFPACHASPSCVLCCGGGQGCL